MAGPRKRLLQSATSTRNFALSGMSEDGLDGRSCSFSRCSRRTATQMGARCYLYQTAGTAGVLENVKGLQEDSCFSGIIFDGGHNATALEALAVQLKCWQIENYTLVLGFAKDKLIDPLKKSLRQLCRHASHIIVTQAQSPRAASPEELYDFFSPRRKKLPASLPSNW